MVDTKDPDKFIEFVKLVQPGLGGVNLEDIAQPKCFRILDTLRAECEIPIWHDDQQGTACVTLAGLINALKVVGRKLEEANIAFIGSGAANVAISRLIFAYGADPARCRVVDSKGILLDRPAAEVFVQIARRGLKLQMRHLPVESQHSIQHRTPLRHQHRRRPPPHDNREKWMCSSTSALPLRWPAPLPGRSKSAPAHAMCAQDNHVSW